MFYQKLLRPILFLLSAETIHKILFFFFRLFPFTGYFFRLTHPSEYFKQNVEAFGLKFNHPVGIAGGLDKNARAIRFLRNMGFAFVEIGTVTPLPQGGNPKPRLFRLTRNSALINRMGFNNDGLDVIANRLRNRPKDLIIGGNIGKNTITPNERAVEDFAACFEGLYPYVDYFVVNVSCPNIKDLSKLQNKDDLTKILNRLLAIRSGKGIAKPVLLKISPDLSEIQLDEVIEVVRETRIDGLVATNTSIRRFNLDYPDDFIESIGQGGLSGSPLREVSTKIIRYLHQRLGLDFPIIGSGGVMNEKDANEKLDSGATLVQLYTGFIYEGPGLLSRILKTLAKKS